MVVCSCREFGTSGCRHTNPHLATSAPHRCSLPGDYAQRFNALTWECGVCGKIWSPGQFGWTEIRGATR